MNIINKKNIKVNGYLNAILKNGTIIDGCIFSVFDNGFMIDDNISGDIFYLDNLEIDSIFEYVE